MKSTVQLFADHCLLYSQIKSVEDYITLQRNLTNLETWAKTWGMSFIAKKCNMYIMSINSKSKHFYQVDSHILQQVLENPYGVTLSEDLKWSSHITKISKKANSTLGFLNRNSKHCLQNCRMTAYLSLICSAIEYSSVIWDPHLQKDIDKSEAGLGGTVGCAIRLETRRLRVQPLLRSATFFCGD